LLEVIDPQKGDVITRWVVGFEGGDMTAGRLYFSGLLLDSLGFSTLLLGSGEGTGEWAAHNAYLIVLQENGVWAALVLVLASFIMLQKAWKGTAITTRIRESHHLELVAPLIVVAWIVILAMNWGQLNQSFPWVFLSLAFMSSRVHPSSILRRMKTETHSPTSFK